ncbi:hypothetical protein SBA3_2800003 [Candidatus Sulfopaludibacter sp. SbA3]|nr:hypothetical protein SBA3_2800003 [Candidatus Sulfopaludibacter sp. SbA3]
MVIHRTSRSKGGQAHPGVLDAPLVEREEALRRPTTTGDECETVSGRHRFADKTVLSQPCRDPAVRMNSSPR